jgi:hypothetical protein
MARGGRNRVRLNMCSKTPRRRVGEHAMEKIPREKGEEVISGVEAGGQ